MIVNNRETKEGDPVFYVDTDRHIYDAVIRGLVERDGLFYAELKVDRDGQHSTVVDAIHNTSTEAHSWNHPILEEERKLHYAPDFYGL